MSTNNHITTILSIESSCDETAVAVVEDGSELDGERQVLGHVGVDVGTHIEAVVIESVAVFNFSDNIAQQGVSSFSSSKSNNKLNNTEIKKINSENSTKDNIEITTNNNTTSNNTDLIQ